MQPLISLFCSKTIRTQDIFTYSSSKVWHVSGVRLLLPRLYNLIYIPGFWPSRGWLTLLNAINNYPNWHGFAKKRPDMSICVNYIEKVTTWFYFKWWNMKIYLLATGVGSPGVKERLTTESISPISCRMISQWHTINHYYRELSVNRKFKT